LLFAAAGRLMAAPLAFAFEAALAFMAFITFPIAGLESIAVQA
jgi:hypothetical protein